MSQQDALLQAVVLLGGKTEAAQKIGVTYTAVLSWLLDESDAQARPLPLPRAMEIERLVRGQVTREQLRPDIDWSRAPELLEASEGQPIPAAVEPSQPVAAL